MMDQYKKETAQIHAPAALLEKTKAAVRAEEERILREQIGQIPTVASGSQVTYADYVACQKKHSLRKWTYPLTAAAAVVIVFSVSWAMKDMGFGDFTGNRSSDSAMMAEETAAGEADSGAAEEMEASEATESIAEGSNDHAASDSAAETVLEEMESGEEAAEAPATDAVEESARDQMAQDNVKKEKAAEKEDLVREDSWADSADSIEDKPVKPFWHVIGGGIKIIEVDEKPIFYDYAGAKDVVYEGETFRVIEQEQGWGAYVVTEEGAAYVICGQAEEQEEFLQKAYEALHETIKSK